VTSIAVLGPGGVGGFLAAALARSGEDVTVVAREETAQHIAEHGLAVDSVRLGRFTARPNAVPQLREPPDILIVATKATGLEDALARVQAAPGLVVPLLNGVEHMDVLRAHYANVVAATIRIAAERTAPGRIAHTSALSRIELAPSTDETEHLVHLLRLAEVPAKTEASEAQVLWSKLARLGPLALSTAASGLTTGPVFAHPRWRLLAQGAVDETAAVAKAEGADVDPRSVLEEIAQLGPEQTSSLARDVEQGNPTELDAIGGAILRKAQQHGLPAPSVQQLVSAVEDRVA
jgi:2-dehydropantoate 2-reductase